MLQETNSYDDQVIPPASEFEGLPAYVPVGGDRRAAYVLFDYRHCIWKAAVWSGPLGDFATRDAALTAIFEAPRTPRRVRTPR